MSAQKQDTPPAVPSGSKTDERSQTGLVRSLIPNVPSLLLDPFGFFREGSSPFKSWDLSRIFERSGLAGSGDRSDPAGWTPAIEVEYKNGNLIVLAELPGLNENDVNVQVVGDALIVQGEKRDQHDQQEGGVRRSEIRYGQFYRVIPLPEGAETDEARAEFGNGVLRVTIPVPQTERKIKQIPVQVPVRASSSPQPESVARKSTSEQTSEKAA